MRPFYECYRTVGGKTFKITFNKEMGQYAAIVEAEDGTTKDCGKWPSITEANAFADIVITDIAGVVEKASQENPLSDHLSRGAVLAVGLDTGEKNYSIIAGYKPWRWEDTGLRFPSQEVARKFLEDAKCGSSS